MKIAEEVKNTRAELEDMVKRPLVAIEGIKEAPVNTTIAKRKIEESRVTTRSENVGRQENVALANAEQEVQLEETKYKSIEEIALVTGQTREKINAEIKVLLRYGVINEK